MPSIRIVVVSPFRFIPKLEYRNVIFSALQCWTPLAVSEPAARFALESHRYSVQDLSFYSFEQLRIDLDFASSVD